ncbi:hypothetical protein V8G54_016438, partial [Vigna mungo]
IFKSLQSDLSSHPINITETQLETLKLLEKLFCCDASSVTATMSAAYCVVAVECTIKCLQLNIYHHNLFYHQAVNKIWRVRIPHMNSFGSRKGSLLFSVELEWWRRDIEAPLLDLQVRERLASINTRRDVIVKLRGCH